MKTTIILILCIAALAAIPFGAIWAANLLMHSAGSSIVIPYTCKTWLAVVILKCFLVLGTGESIRR